MFVIGYFFLAIAELLEMVLNIFSFLLVVRCILSWVNPYFRDVGDIVNFIYTATDFILDPIKRYFPVVIGMIDLSPIIAFLIVYFCKNFFVKVLFTCGYRLL